MFRAHIHVYKIIAVCIAVFMFSYPVAAESVVPYSNIRYDVAFDQEAIYKKYKSLLMKSGCLHNVFPDSEVEQCGTNFPLEKHTLMFEKKCLEQLEKARTTALAEPGVLAVVEMGVWVASALATLQFVKRESLGGSFAVFAGVSDIARLTPRIIKSGHELWYRPSNSLGALEERFAKNKCYIPRILWPKIIKSFASARENQFSQQVHIDFLENALSLTIYKRKPHVVCKNGMSKAEVQAELMKRISDFFKDYQHGDEVGSIGQVKINCLKFINSLFEDGVVSSAQQAPQYMYLHGPGGIGKTHFVQILSTWIDELIPQSVCFEDLVIHGADELEGSEHRPGALLNVLRKQLIQNKRGSIIMLDEATWLNDASMLSCAKRVFNGDRSKLSTAYFGTGIDGSALTLEIPPMLVFVASNDVINDPALASRFDIVNYPLPTVKALVNHAIKTAYKSIILSEGQCPFDGDQIHQWVQDLGTLDKNFRYVANNIEHTILNCF